MRRWNAFPWFFGGLLLFLSFTACSQKIGWDKPIAASTPEEFTTSRERLVAILTPEQLQAFDTAIQELKLDAMDKGVAGTSAREQHMRSTVNGKTVRDATLLGWKARKARFERELKDMSDRLAHDSQLANRSGSTEPSRTVSNLVQNEQDIVAQLKKQLEDADHHIENLSHAD